MPAALDGSRLPVLIDVGAMPLGPTAEIIEVSTEDATCMVEFPPCDIPGVGIIVPIGEEELTSCGYCWL
jgi:hypothetical protein